MQGMLEQLTCRWLACWLAREAEAGRELWVFAPYQDLSSWGAGHSHLGPLCAVAVCASEFICGHGDKF